MCAGRRVDRDGPNLDTVRSVEIERAVRTDRRSRELAVSTPDRQIATGIGYRQARALPSPSAICEWPFSWSGRIFVTRE